MEKNVFVVKCSKNGRKRSYILQFPYDDHVISRIRELPTSQRKWDSINKVWELKYEGLYELLLKFKGSNDIYFDFGENRENFKKEIVKIKKDKEEKEKVRKKLETNKLKWVKWKEELEENYHKYSEELHGYLKDGIQLYPHQIIGSLFIDKVRNALLAHDMGLGKTVQSITYVEKNGFEKILVITPNSLKFNYYYEIEKFSRGSKAYIVNWNKNKYSIEESKYIIVNYEYFNPSSDSKMKQKWMDLKINVLDAVISDESQKLKSSKSNTYKNFKKYVGNKKLFRNGKVSMIYMSGTPAPNRAYELYNVLNQISPIDFPNKKHFYEYYCGMEYDYANGWGWEKTGEGNLEELFHKISPYTHRKRKSEVLTDLPDKIYNDIKLELTPSQKKDYEEIESDVISDLENIENNSNPLTKMLRLRQILSRIKATSSSDLIENLLDSGEKIVIVDQFKDGLYELNKKYKDISALHTGDQTVDERSEIVKKFQDKTSDLRIFLGSIQTCNFGLTLTAASNMIVMTMPYIPGEYDQVVDRIYRIGQNFSVNIYNLLYVDTIDEYVYDMVYDKKTEITQVIDNEKFVIENKESSMYNIINKIKSKHGSS